MAKFISELLKWLSAILSMIAIAFFLACTLLEFTWKDAVLIQVAWKLSWTDLSWFWIFVIVCVLSLILKSL